MHEDDLEAEAAILVDVVARALAYWQRWLWNEPELLQSPDEQFCRQISERFNADAVHVRRVWHRWFSILTSREYAFAVIAAEMNRLKSPKE